MQGKCIGEHSAILLTFIKLPFVIKIFVLYIFESHFYTGFTVVAYVLPRFAIIVLEKRELASYFTCFLGAMRLLVFVSFSY